MAGHIQRVQTAIDYIEERLTDDGLELADVAAEAGYSSWHFQRLFGAVAGDSLKGYVRRRRLTRAWQDLAGTPRRVLDIALDSGFESQEAFTRAFKALFGVTPGAARQSAAEPPARFAKLRITRDYLEHLSGGLSMEPRIVDCPSRSVVGLATRFISIMSPDRNNHEVIPALWGAFMSRQAELNGVASPGPHFGLIEALPPAARSRPDEFWYMAGAPLAPGAKAPKGMEVKEVPAGKYAMFTHKGPLTTLEHTMRYIFATWLPRSSFELREAPDIEVYGEKFSPGAADSELEIGIPIK